MPVIRQLNPHVADLIAAGEVVERPFSSGWSRRGPQEIYPARRKRIPPCAKVFAERKRLYAGFPA